MLWEIDMDYKKIYNSIVERSKTRLYMGYTEKHHIIPRCLGGTDEIDNLVDLTPEEHYTCHQLLVKMYPGNCKLLNAALFMTANGMGRRSNKVYGWLKRRYSEYMRGPNNPQRVNPRSGTRHHYFGKHLPLDHFTKEGKKRLSESKLGSRNPNFGIKPWKHPNSTEYTLSVWKDADTIYNTWVSIGKPSYCKLHRIVTGNNHKSPTIAPFMSLVEYFRKDWVPIYDADWIQFKNE